MPSEVGDEEAVARIRNLRYGPADDDDDCDGHCFDLRMQEPSCRDDLHLSETVPYLVMEAGTWYTDAGKMIQVGRAAAAGSDQAGNVFVGNGGQATMSTAGGFVPGD